MAEICSATLDYSGIKNLTGRQHKNVSQTHQHGVDSMINVFPVVEVIINVWSYTDPVVT